MKKIIISTFNNSKNNYGALFQSYALSKYLRDLGYDAQNVTIENRSNLKVSFQILLKRKLKKILRFNISNKIKRRKNKFSEFSKETQNQIVYADKESLKENPPIGDVYLSGSDQVWNPCNIHEDFFLTYADDNAKKISYAASMGNEDIPEKNKKIFSQLIKQYDYISVREDSMIDIIRKYTDKTVNHNVDPVFLLSKNDWIKKEKKYSSLKYEKYILVYVLEWNAESNAKLKQVKSDLGLPVVSINCDNMAKICADQVIFDASPSEFLFLLNNCEYVVSSSFHGIAMSIIYNKPFVAVVGKDKSTRITSLLRHFNLFRRTEFDHIKEKIDYNLINTQIVNDVEDAKAYLINAIEN